MEVVIIRFSSFDAIEQNTKIFGNIWGIFGNITYILNKSACKTTGPTLQLAKTANSSRKRMLKFDFLKSRNNSIKLSLECKLSNQDI